MYNMDVPYMSEEMGYAAGNTGNRLTGKIPICYYIASNNPEGAINLLSDYGMRASRDTNSIANGLKHLIKNGKEKDLQRILKLHPDFDLFEKHFRDEAVHSADGESVKKQPDPMVVINQVEPMKNFTGENNSGDMTNSRTFITIATVGVTLAAVATTVYLIKSLT